LLQEVGLDDGGSHVVVPQLVLNGAEVGAVLTQVGAEGITNSMGADGLRRPSGSEPLPLALFMTLGSL
jgi:hypothetical protein